MMVKSSEQRKMLKTRATIVEAICHGERLLADISVWAGSVSNPSLLVIPSISICDLPISNLEPYMFRISTVDESSCRVRCVRELVEDILRDALVVQGVFAFGCRKQLRQKLARAWDAEEAHSEASESRGRNDARLR